MEAILHPCCHNVTYETLIFKWIPQQFHSLLMLFFFFLRKRTLRITGQASRRGRRDSYAHFWRSRPGAGRLFVRVRQGSGKKTSRPCPPIPIAMTPRFPGKKLFQIFKKMIEVLFPGMYISRQSQKRAEFRLPGNLRKEAQNNNKEFKT